MTCSSHDSDGLLVGRIRQGDSEAWNELISRFEGRLLAYVQARVANREAAEDVVQETFIGFLTSLPNFDARRSLESYLFSIAAHKLTDHLRREGRRPTLSLNAGGTGSWELPAEGRAASSVVRSGERRGLEEEALAAAIRREIARWRDRGDWRKIQCAELLFVRGWANRQVASELGITEQAVANYKFEFLARLRGDVRAQGLPEEIFPELYER